MKTEDSRFNQAGQRPAAQHKEGVIHMKKLLGGTAAAIAMVLL
jgi:hypothetical protein